MNELAKQIIVYSAAEQLAKDADFKGDGINPYLERSTRYYDGDHDAFTGSERQVMRVQELHLLDRESLVVEENPMLKTVYADSNLHQLLAATDPRNLTFYLQNGVEYDFDVDRLDYLRPSLHMDSPISGQLMRERIVGISGIDPVRLNVVYHDIMDHLWAINELRESGVDHQFQDFVEEVGRPFTGFLFSKQAELLSGIGYNTRRYVTSPDNYVNLAASVEAINQHMSASAEEDERVSVALSKINENEDLASAAGFVINGALGSLLLQRSRAGSVKRIKHSVGEPEITDTPVRLMDPRYISIMIEGVGSLLQKEHSYRQMQLDLNLTIESLLREVLEKNLAVGSLALGSTRDISNIPSHVRDELTRNAGVSTSYYS